MSRADLVRDNDAWEEVIHSGVRSPVKSRLRIRLRLQETTEVDDKAINEMLR